MALAHPRFTEAGAVVAGISIDSPAQNAAMVAKLNLPFPLLSDPDRSKAIAPFGLADPHDGRNIAIPATIVIGPDGDEVWRYQSSDFADRPAEDTALEIVRGLGLGPVTQPPPRPGHPEPGPNAMPYGDLRPYYRGAKFGAVAVARRVPEAKEASKALGEMLDRYLENVTTMYRITRDRDG